MQQTVRVSDHAAEDYRFATNRLRLFFLVLTARLPHPVSSLCVVFDSRPPASDSRLPLMAHELPQSMWKAGHFRDSEIRECMRARMCNTQPRIRTTPCLASARRTESEISKKYLKAACPGY